MRLMYDRISKTINIKNNDLTIIGTNNSIAYTDLNLGFQSRNDVLELIDKNYHILQLSKVFDYEGNIIDNENLFDKYKRPIINQIIFSLNDNQLQTILLKQSEIHNLAEKILFANNNLISINNLCDIRKVFTPKNVDFTVFKSLNPYDIIRGDIQIHAKYFSNKILVMCNLSHYLSEKNLYKVKQQIKANNLSLVDLDFVELETSNSYFKCNYYIDNDFEIWKP